MSIETIERQLRGRTGKYTLKPNTHGKAAVWKSFSIVYEKGVESEDLIQNVTCCNKCFKCYQLKDARGRPNGTKNLIDHLGRCSGPVSQGQLQLTQCLKSTPNISKNDMETLKRKQVEYCVDGYNSFRSVEHKGLLNLLQTCVDYGAKYGTFDLAKILYSIMSAVARRVFVVSASSAQSERDFSAVGRTITDARSQLSASKVEAVEMLRWGMKAGLV